LLQALYASVSALQSSSFRSRYAARIRQRGANGGLTSKEVNALVTVLATQSRVGTPTLERIRASGVLRVGLPGDYAPFAVEMNGELSGVDVQLLTEFAKQEQLQLRFVRTSWTMLLKDFQSNLFDIAAGGISITPERSSVASFSLPYHSGGKTPIVRCGEELRFDTLDKINRATVRLIVNPDGTNERFAREQLSQAQLRIHPDNRTAFDEIAAGRADAMVTDDIEVEMQVHSHRSLCRATAQTFTHSDKAWLLPNDPALLTEVNQWMEWAARSGLVRADFNAFMSGQQH
jgi:cyclohexadienyl dehydratase